MSTEKWLELTNEIGNGISNIVENPTLTLHHYGRALMMMAQEMMPEDFEEKMNNLKWAEEGEEDKEND